MQLKKSNQVSLTQRDDCKLETILSTAQQNKDQTKVSVCVGVGGYYDIFIIFIHT